MRRNSASQTNAVLHGVTLLFAILVGCGEPSTKALDTTTKRPSQAHVISKPEIDKIKAMSTRMQSIMTKAERGKIADPDEDFMIAATTSELPGMAANASLKLRLLYQRGLIARKQLVDTYVNSLAIQRGANAFLVVQDLMEFSGVDDKVQRLPVKTLLRLCHQYADEPRFTSEEIGAIGEMVEGKSREGSIASMLLLVSKWHASDAEYIRRTFRAAKMNSNSEPPEFWDVLEAALHSREDNQRR